MAAMVFGMPLLMKNMDPAELAQMQQQQAAMGNGDPFASLGKLFGADEPAGPSSAAAGNARVPDAPAPTASSGATGSTVRQRKAR